MEKIMSKTIERELAEAELDTVSGGLVLWRYRVGSIRSRPIRMIRWTVPIGRTTGHGVAGNLCRHCPGWLLRASRFLGRAQRQHRKTARQYPFPKYRPQLTVK